MLAKKTENEAVMAEFKMLDEDAKVYKLVGPILAKQDLSDCTQNVSKRIEFIDKEIARLETLEADFQGKVTDKSANIKKLQNEFQRIILQVQQAAQQASQQ
jgi:prefoldin beta subunit